MTKCNPKNNTNTSSIGSDLSTNLIDTSVSEPLEIGPTVASQVDIGSTFTDTNIKGDLNLFGVIDMETSASGNLLIGGSNADGVELGGNGINTIVNGDTLFVAENVDALVLGDPLNIGDTNANEVNLGSNVIDTYVKGDLFVKDSIDKETLGGTFYIGDTNAGSMTIGKIAQITKFPGEIRTDKIYGDGGGTLRLGYTINSKVDLGSTTIPTQVLSTENPISISTGAFRVSGGMGVTNDVYVGGGINLGDALLETYDTTELTVDYSAGFWTSDQTGKKIYIERIGNMITLSFEGVQVNGDNINSGFVECDTVVPVGFRPFEDQWQPISAINDGVWQDVMSLVYIQTDGTIEIWKTRNNKNWSAGAGSMGFASGVVSYYVA